MRSSWLTMPRNSARSRSCSSSGFMSWSVTTKEASSPSSARIGVALSRMVTLRPSGTRSTISSARTVSPSLNSSGSDSSARETSRPSARTQVSTLRRSSAGWSPSRSSSTTRSASRLKETGAPVRASKTATPTGEVLTSVSRSARACRSSRCVRALAMTRAAWEANITSVSSSSRENSRPGSALPT